MKTSKTFKHILGCLLLILPASQWIYAQGTNPAPETKRIIDHWTPARRAQAIPRDLVIDEHGQGYLRKQNGALEPYGHTGLIQLDSQSTPLPLDQSLNAATTSADVTPPSITIQTPGNGQSIGSSQTFSAKITDASGIKSVSFEIMPPNNGLTQSFTPNRVAGSDTWQTTLQGFSDGSWQWRVIAKDRAKPANTTTSETISFTVNTSGSGNTGVVPNDEWPIAPQNEVGRIYFEMPSNRRLTKWVGYVCSGTVATDGISERSIIITAAHCVYDDVNKAFARNILFIPNQDGTSVGSRTDRDCTNDPLGCWAPSFGVVDNNWAIRTFPDNIAWDYSFYVVTDSDPQNALDFKAGSIAISFDAAATQGVLTDALGYSYSYDPKLMYCTDHLTTEGFVNWWLASCELSGGSSGGPWMQQTSDNGNGPIISVNSWGYTNSAGMAGPKLVGTSASKLFEEAKITGADRILK